jgi:hypothetical protein
VRRRAVALCRTRHFTCGTRDRRRGDHRHQQDGTQTPDHRDQYMPRDERAEGGERW